MDHDLSVVARGHPQPTGTPTVGPDGFRNTGRTTMASRAGVEAWLAGQSVSA
jgi:hypothetical protein